MDENFIERFVTLEADVAHIKLDLGQIRANYATKQDLEVYATKEDLAVICSNYATKEDVAKLETQIAKLESRLITWFISTATALAAVSISAAVATIHLAR
ncbi:hypothetical protein [Massilia sp. erpn]|uniref:hypothetical protein n=1 Tax=Massilia sp. erpn TaxID=2738142 RepID=UPI0021040A7E|nr:hypothetical protein [Massilia sp. erpn]UTY56689.1 hypothetical protein HPQ68_05525 [Massilia sp. erpn]